MNTYSQHACTPQPDADGQGTTDEVDFSRCPRCGAEELEIRTEERLSATNHLALTLEGGRLVGAAFGLTEPRWDDCETAAYIACCCGEELPEPYQAALDVALHNNRVEA